MWAAAAEVQKGRGWLSSLISECQGRPREHTPLDEEKKSSITNGTEHA